MTNHPLECQKCKDFKKVEIIWVRYNEEIGKEIDLNIPFYTCPNCGDKEPLWEKEFYDKLVEDEFKKMQDNEQKDLLFKYESQKFPYYSKLKLKYSPEDYFLIPGLSRPENDGYLIPVFFDKDVLLYYNNHPDYSVQFSSFSSGNIYFKEETLFSWGFGINRNDKIFMWLGDIYEDFEGKEMENHLKRFQASNVDSDHDIYSKFYLMQNPFSPKDAFQNSDNETRLFKLKNNLDELFENKFGFSLTKLKIDDLFEFYKPPILEEKEQIFNAYISLNKLIVENIYIDKLKLKINNTEKVKKLGTLKTLEYFLTDYCKIDNANELTKPFYVLSDLRQLQGHFNKTSFDKKYLYCKNRLELDSNVSYFKVYEKLIENFIKTYDNLITKIEDCR